MSRPPIPVLPVALLFFIPVLASGGGRGGEAPPTTVSRVDPARYAGLWHEVARIPNRFQKSCAGNTTAQYTLRDDGRIDVVNRCLRDDGTYIEARGIARIADPETNARLKVSFVRFLGISLFWGDYWIIGLDPDYRWAVVGEPSRKTGWVLGREPVLSDDELEKIDRLLTDRGYDPGRFVPAPRKPSQDEDA